MQAGNASLGFQDCRTVNLCVLFVMIVHNVPTMRVDTSDHHLDVNVRVSAEGNSDGFPQLLYTRKSRKDKRGDFLSY